MKHLEKIKIAICAFFCVFFTTKICIFLDLQVKVKKFTVLDTTISPPNSNDLKPCKNFLQNRKFPGRIIFTGQKRGWCFARKETPLNSNGVDPCEKVHLSLGGGWNSCVQYGKVKIKPFFRFSPKGLGKGLLVDTL